MDLSTTANVMEVIGFVGAVLAGIYKLGKIIRKRVADANDVAEEGRKLVAKLISRATSPARRADIHAYIQIRAVEIQGRRTRAKIELFFMFAVGLLLGIGSIYVGKSDSLEFSLPASISIIIFESSFLFAFLMLLISERNLHRIEDGWLRAVEEHLGAKIDQHLQDQ